MIEDPLTDPITHDFPCEGSHDESRCPLSLVESASRSSGFEAELQAQAWFHGRAQCVTEIKEWNCHLGLFNPARKSIIGYSMREPPG
jgi:hypothetical protein